MIIFSEERYISTEVNMMIIRAKDNIGYYYVHRGLYDQAVVLSDLYGDRPAELCKLITGNDESRVDVEEFLMDLPKPINILGCFLLLVEGEITDKLDRVGAVHVMSGPINFRKFVKVPAEVRSEVTFSLSISEEYQIAWDRFFKEAIPFNADFYKAPTVAPMNGTATVLPIGNNSELVNTSEYAEEDVDPDELLLEALMSDDWDEEAALLEDGEDTDEDDVDVPPVAAPAPEPVVEDVVESSPKPSAPSGLDFLRRMSQ